MAHTVNLVEKIDSVCEYESRICDPDKCSLLIGNNRHNFKIFIQNIRSINCNFDGLLALLSLVNVNPDVILLTECWLSNYPSLPHIEGYNIHATKSTNRLQNDGVILYVKREIDKVKTFEPDIEDANCLVAKTGDTAIVSIYRSPSYHNITNFLHSLSNILKSLSSFKNIFIIGDLNIDIKSGNKDRNSIEYLTYMAYHGFLPTHTLPTRKGNCLDHILAKTNTRFKSFVLNSTLTDHSSLLFCVQQKYNRTYAITNRTKLNSQNLSRDLDNLDLTPIYNSSDANEATEYLVSSLMNIIKVNTQTIVLSRRNKIIKPWITPGLLRCIRHRDKLHQKLTKFPNNDALLTTYSRYRNFCNSLLKKLKRNYEKSEIQNAGHDKKRLWKVIKNIAHISNKKLSAQPLITNQATALHTINQANSFFINMGKALAEKIKGNSSQPHRKHSRNRTLHSFALIDTDEAEVDRVIMTMRNDCATGLDKIPCFFIKQYKRYLIPPLTYIFNLCFSKGIFPNVLKQAVVHPIYKSGDKSCINNYRPIALLPSLSKVLERLIYNRLVKYLENNKLLAHSQYGFRSKKSTEDAVHELTDYIIKQLESHKKCLAIFLDLAKAFDTVSIPMLLDKLDNLGIRGIPYELLKDYLTNRTQRLKIDHIISDELLIEYGVPQGSILGPILFLIYINELCLLPLSDSKIITYADDTVLLCSSENWENTFNTAQTGFDVINQWLKQNLLTLNSDKTKFMTFSYNPSTQPPQNTFSILAHLCSNTPGNECDCPKLSSTDTMKYLGVFIDKHLSFKLHIEALIARVRKLIYVFKNLRHAASGNLIKTVYLALCESILTYCITIWGGTHKSSLIGLERAQRAILKVSTFRPFRYPTTKLLAECDVLSVRQLFILQTINKQHSITPFTSSFQTSKRRVDIVCKYDYIFKTAHSHKFFCFLGSFLYNRLNFTLCIYPMNQVTCKKTVESWLKGKTYDETENLLLVDV